MEELLRQSGLTIITIEGKYIDLAHGYRIETERPDLWKLSQDGMVIAPFDDAAELVDFIIQDWTLNGWR